MCHLVTTYNSMNTQQCPPVVYPSRVLIVGFVKSRMFWSHPGAEANREVSNESSWYFIASRSKFAGQCESGRAKALWAWCWRHAQPDQAVDETRFPGVIPDATAWDDAQGDGQLDAAHDKRSGPAGDVSDDQFSDWRERQQREPLIPAANLHFQKGAAGRGSLLLF